MSLPPPRRRRAAKIRHEVHLDLKHTISASHIHPPSCRSMLDVRALLGEHDLVVLINELADRKEVLAHVCDTTPEYPGL